jgi:two-component system, OmpR family, sensor histidine kinase KdpD
VTHPEDNRPDPDALLALADAERGDASTLPKCGRLKIFLGMCAGVGKTYTMLQDARARRAEGVDVLIGLVETHKRPETEALLADLPILPRRRISYRGVELTDFDLDGALARKPTLIIIDELPHSNAPGARHLKRYQDVIELLDAGINVYTALNVQHLESRADSVAQITGTVVRETVPDSILERTDEIELIDLSPEELLKRLADGKVYLGEGRATAAAESFFRKGNLTALREMSLRITAEHVDQQMRDYMRVKRIAGPWKSTERLLVAVNGGPLSERLIRHTRRLAYNLEAPWLAVHVETSATQREDKTGLERNLALARKLGAEAITTTDTDVVNGLLRIARQHNISQIVAGRTRATRLGSGWRSGSVMRRLIDESGAVDVHLVGGEDLDQREQPASLIPFQSTPRAYGEALALIALVIGAGYAFFLSTTLGYQIMALVFLLAIVLLSLRYARGPVLAATTLSALALNFLFIQPYFTFTIDHSGDVVLFVLYFAIAAVLGALTTRIRTGAQLLRQREAQAVASFAFASGMSRAVTMDDVCQVATERISAYFDVPVHILLPDGTGKLNSESPLLDARELGVASWAFEHRRVAGKFTDTLPTATSQHVPLLTSNGAVGVLSIALRERPGLQQVDLLNGLASQTALAVERELLDESAKRRGEIEASDRLSKTLLNLISHELRTPITAINGAAGSLTQPEVDNDPAARLTLHESIRDSATRLNQLIENLLDMTRLESGTLRLNTDWIAVSELVQIVRERTAAELRDHEFIVNIEPDLPLVRMDAVLMAQVFYNLLHNAALYTPPGTRVRLSASREGAALVLAVMDRGPGLPPEALLRAFEKFHRAGNSAVTGLGLGLSICKGLVEAHGGTISAENRVNGGLRVTIRLPIQPAPALPARTDDDD